MTDETTDRTEILSGPEPTEFLPVPDQGPAAAPTPEATGRPATWMAGPPPPPPGQDPAVPVRDASPRSDRPQPGPPGRRSWPGPDLRSLRSEPVWLLGAAGILVAYAAAWLGAVLTAVGHQPGLSGQDRVLELIGPGSVEWAVILLVGLGLTAGARHVAADRTSGPLRHLVVTTMLVATAAVAGAALLGAVVELADFGHGVDRAFTGIVDRLGALAVAGPALWWARQEQQQTAL